MSKNLSSQNVASQKGASLIEVLISALVMGVGLLGVVSLQARSLQNNQLSYLYSQATFLAQDMAERMQANRSAAESYNIDIDDPNPSGVNLTTCTAGNCTPEQVADWDMLVWRTKIASLLPSGKAGINRFSALRESVIEIQFDGSRGQGDPQLMTFVLSIE